MRSSERRRAYRAVRRFGAARRFGARRQGLLRDSRNSMDGCRVCRSWRSECVNWSRKKRANDAPDVPPGSLSYKRIAGFATVRGMDFDFYSLSGRGSENPRGATGEPLATVLHTISRSVAIQKHFKQPSGPDGHLLVLGNGSPFLVDRKGKPKDNISVSMSCVEFGRQGRPIFHLVPSWSL